MQASELSFPVVFHTQNCAVHSVLYCYRYTVIDIYRYFNRTTFPIDRTNNPHKRSCAASLGGGGVFDQGVSTVR